MTQDGASDLREDKASLTALYMSMLERVGALEETLEHSREQYYPDTYGALLNQTKNFILHGSRALNDLNACEFSIEKKKEYADVLRVLHMSAAALLAAPNWQSPSFWHTKMPQAGTDAGHVSASDGDYKRDMHRDEKEYARAFVKEYVDHTLRLPPFVYATSSGMAAITTVLVHLQEKVKENDVVLAGRASYFQNKWQLEKLFGNRVRYVDECDTEEILKLAKEHMPPIVFLDSLCGAESLPMPDLKKLIPGLSKILPHSSTLVLDNTGLGTLYQPLHDLPINPFGMNLIVVESLLKFHQFGMDRVGGGIIWTPSIAENGLFEARMHLGTMLPDASALALPRPNRALLDQRLVRIGRNAKFLAEKLNELVGNGGGLIEKVVHPSLPNYKGYEWTKDLQFQGAFITLRFRDGKRSVSHYDAFVSRVAALAKKTGVDIVGGTSFGFDITRLYVTARYATNITEPFVRISVGTETLGEIDALARVFAEALSS